MSYAGAVACAGFEAAMQRYSVHVLAMTYLKVPLPVLAEVRRHWWANGRQGWVGPRMVTLQLHGC